MNSGILTRSSGILATSYLRTSRPGTTAGAFAVASFPHRRRLVIALAHVHEPTAFNCGS